MSGLSSKYMIRKNWGQRGGWWLFRGRNFNLFPTWQSAIDAMYNDAAYQALRKSGGKR